MIKTFSILLLIFFINILEINAQINKPGASEDQQIKTNLLLEKAKKQKSTAWILLGSGAGVALAGYIIAGTSSRSFLDDPTLRKLKNSGWGIVMSGTGMAAMIASIPFFIASGRNKRKANLVFQNESQSFLHQLHKGNNYSVGVRLNF